MSRPRPNEKLPVFSEPWATCHTSQDANGILQALKRNYLSISLILRCLASSKARGAQGNHSFLPVRKGIHRKRGSLAFPRADCYH